jgi:hypothetical protein
LDAAGKPQMVVLNETVSRFMMRYAISGCTSVL